MSDEHSSLETNNDDSSDDSEDAERHVQQGEQPPSGSEPLAAGVNNENLNLDRPLSSELQRRRTEALERILLASDSNLSLPQAQSPNTPRRIRLGGRLGLRSQSRNLFNRRLLSRDNLESAIFIPLRTRSSASGTSLPTTTTSHQDSARALRNLISSRGASLGNAHSDNNTRNGQRINVSTFFMELTYSTDPHHFHNLFKNSTEAQRRRIEVHAANALSLIKAHCPVKLNKMSQFRCCIKTQRFDYLDFKNLNVKPLDDLDPTQNKCNTQVIVIVRDECGSGNNWGSPCTSYLLSYLNKKRILPTCITFQSDASLNALTEELHDLRAFSENIHDPTVTKQVKCFLIMSTVAKLLESWNIPVLVLDSCPSKIVDVDSVMSFAQRFQIKTLDLDSDGGASKQWKAIARRVGKQVKKIIVESNVNRIRADIARRAKVISALGNNPSCPKTGNLKSHSSATSTIGDDCRRIVYNLHDRIGWHNSDNTAKDAAFLVHAPSISLLEDGILADIESSVAFRSNSAGSKGESRSGRKVNSRCNIVTREPNHRNNCELDFKRGISAVEQNESTNRPRTSYSQKSEEDVLIPAVGFATTARDQGKVSELLFNELNQRWRVHGPQRFVPSAQDCDPYCDPILDSEKQLLFSVLQEVASFEMLKDIRNELKDSKKDLEGRLYGYNPDFANLIASAEEFLHGKASCMEPCEDEVNFYKMPISLLYSESEVKYMKAKPPLYVTSGESPSQTIKAAIEESTQNQTRAIVVIEDNNEVLELLTVALWFFEKTPLATFQAKYYHSTDEFLLSLDACRLFCATYPSFPAKKDEKAFEKWLGVGMNGILRSHSSKILIIDLPRPGMPLEHAKKILLTRLKIEEKLHGIKSFMAGSPSRKEDNLSTVEYLMDEIQKCLKPRMYMDLKLYKQIEQKSRQDVKFLRDWGLPDPENEHDFWEAIRNSDLVINTSVHHPEVSYSLPESRELTAVSVDASSDIMTGTLLTDGESGEGESTFQCYKMDRQSEEEDTTLCDTLLDTIMPNPFSESLQDVDQHLADLNLIRQPDAQFYAHHNDQYLRREQTGIDNIDISLESLGHTIGSESEVEKVTAPHLENDAVEVKGDGDHEECLYSPSALRTKEEALPNGTNKAGEGDKHDDVELQETRASSSKVRKKWQRLKRSPGILNLLDENELNVNFKSSCDFWVASDCSTADSINANDVLVVRDEDSPSEGYTKLEFTLAPELTSRESSPANMPFLVEPKDEKLCVESSTSSLPHASNVVVKARSEIGNRGLERKLTRKSSLHEKCVAHLSKWGKSFTHLIKTSRPWRIFPERLFQHDNAALGDPNCNTNNVNNTKEEEKQVSQKIQVLSLDSSETSLADRRNGNENIHANWLHNLTRYFSGRAMKNSFRTKVLYKRTK